MSYTALYRKWRPVSFEDVKGQDPIVQTLKNQITSERIGHAYLFCGTRGTGKTSIAKIYARAVNCEHPVDGSPCNQCPSCKSILAGTSMNVVEIDAASVTSGNRYSTRLQRENTGFTSSMRSICYPSVHLMPF